ncbi:hypothetical protein EPR50_G00021340 [Perca flavescens]|uniref:Uncharacterized protein n=1 Tax=Perca flavescens TaxID=8167 RepID=A0A484DPF1_PERFV|nr:hypothetical protein EPR50_G00021340 [Perca flavescens]
MSKHLSFKVKLTEVVPYFYKITPEVLVATASRALHSCFVSGPQYTGDKADQPQIIPKTFIAKGTIVGNGHENWALLRLLPLMDHGKL